MYVQNIPAHVSFDRVGVKGWNFPVLSESQKSGFSIIKTEKGHQTKIVEKVCDFCYFILEGEGFFDIDGVHERCEVGDLVVVTAGKAFQYSGNLEMLLVSTPGWYPEQEETLE